MADPYLGEIRMFAGNYAPQFWEFCNGQLLAIAQYDALFALIGTTYGGDGVNNFALPDLRGRIPVDQGQGPGLSKRIMGQMGGAEKVALTVDQLPVHSHAVMITTAVGTLTSPAGAFWATNINQYSSTPPDSLMSAAAIAPMGNNFPHENMMPYLCINFIICIENGYWPDRP
jgi:microcystin-dependent protein